MNTQIFVLAVLVTAVWGCAVDARDEPSSYGQDHWLCPIARAPRPPAAPRRSDGKGDLPAAAEPLAAWPHVAAALSSGGVAVFDPVAGALVADSPARLGAVVDLAFDRHRGELTVVSLAGDEAATLSTFAWDPGGAALGPPVPRAFLEGYVRVQPAPAGVVAFRHTYAPQWELLLDGDAFHGDPLLPMPRSVWAGGDGAWVGALTVAEGVGSQVSLWAGGGPLVATVDDTFEVGSTPRLTPSAPLDGHLVADLTDAGLRLRLRRDGLTVASATWGVPPGARVEHIATMVAAEQPGPARERVALWLTHPAEGQRAGTLLVADVDGELTTLAMATALLDGAAHTDEQAFGRPLVVLARDTLVVATDHGPWHVAVVGAADGFALEVSPACAGCGLVGPLALLDEPAGGAW